MKKISVFCGSNLGNDSRFKEQAQLLGQTLAKNNIALIYGGAKVGLMGAVADGVMMEKGDVIGVLPEFLNLTEIAHDGITELILVDTMHERKSKMNELCDGVIALPGGFGTLEEFFEMLTWGQLGLHEKPVALLNINGFYDFLLTFCDILASEGFMKKEHREMILVSDDINNLLNQMKEYQVPKLEKWILNNKN